MSVILGFDPGGEDGFGWAILQSADTLPLRLLSGGVADNASEVLVAIRRALPPGEHPLAAGIDAPLFWATTGDRRVDYVLRAALRRLGARSPGGTVQAVNSLRGACLVQGVLIATLLRSNWPAIQISESHPKVYLWLSGHARRGTHHNSVRTTSLPEFAASTSLGATDHERDAALAGLSAWAMIHRPEGWIDLRLQESGPHEPVPPPLGYWMPDPTLIVSNSDLADTDDRSSTALKQEDFDNGR